MKKLVILLFAVATLSVSAQEIKSFISLQEWRNDKDNIPTTYYSVLTKNKKVLGPYMAPPVVIDNSFFYQNAKVNKCGRANLNGEIIFEKTGKVLTYSRKHIVVSENNTMAAIDTKGNVSIKPGLYTAIGPLVNQYTWAKNGNKLYIIDSVGNIITETNGIESIDNSFNKYGIALAKKTSDQWGYVNIKGEFITLTNYSNDKRTWGTTDNFADHVIIKATEQRKSKEVFTYYTANGTELKTKTLKKWGLAFTNPIDFNIDNDDEGLYETEYCVRGLSIVDKTGERVEEYVKMEDTHRGRIFMHKDTVEFYYKTNVYDNNSPDVSQIYIYNGKGLTPCKECKQTINFFTIGSSDWYLANIKQFLWEDISISEKYNSETYFTVSTKNGKEINYSPFEELTTQTDCIVLTTHFFKRNQRDNSSNNNFPSSTKTTMSARWTSEVTDYLKLFEYFDKAFNSYKSNQNSENQGQVRYWLTKLIDANTTITNVLRRSNDGSMTTTEQSDYLRMAETKSQELQKFSDNLGKSSVSVLEAIVIGFARGGR
jgi:hypothetical protein